jgi:hypothetical protein
MLARDSRTVSRREKFPSVADVGFGKIKLHHAPVKSVAWRCVTPTSSGAPVITKLDEMRQTLQKRDTL